MIKPLGRLTARILPSPRIMGRFSHNRAGGSGLMAGSVFGRLAGEHAARAALSEAVRV